MIRVLHAGDTALAVAAYFVLQCLVFITRLYLFEIHLVLFGVENFHILNINVGLNKQALIWHVPVEGEAHWPMIRVLHAGDTALAVAAYFVLQCLVFITRSIIDYHCEPEVHTLSSTLGK